MIPAVPPETFRTDRLLLRRPTTADAEAIFEGWGRDPEVTRYLVWRPHDSVVAAREHVARCRTSWEAGSEFVWLIQHLDGTDLVGSLASRHNEHGVNLGYLLARRCWGRGYMVEALAPVVDWWLARPGVHRVWATTDVENRASARVLEKAGFGLEGILRRWDRHPNVGPEPRDAFCYSRVR
jgi:ribosomal-protein-alanine N-acetyltransferase